MSLHDVSKHDSLRLDPKANASDTRAQRDAHSTIGFSLTRDTTTNAPYIAIKNGQFQVYKADGTLLGQLGFRDSDGTGAVDVAKPNSSL